MKHATKPEAITELGDEVRAAVASNLSDELKAQRWSQRKAAEALGLTPRYVNSRTSGDVELSASDLALFARFLGVPVQRFFAEPKEQEAEVIDMPKGATRRGTVP